MKRFLALFSVLLLAGPVGASFAAGSYYQDWNVPDDPAGWTANTAQASVAVVNAGGNPGGYLQSTRDPGGVFPIGTMTELPEVSGDWAAAGVFQVSFDVRFETGDFTGAVFRVRYLDPTFNGWYRPFTADFTPGVWRSYAVVFDPLWTDAEAMAAGWIHELPSPSFAETMANVYHPEIRLNGVREPLVAGIDNFRLHTCERRTVTLFADFGADTPGLPPDLTLPGDPDCDALALSEASGTVTVQAAVGTLVDQPILFDQVPGIGGLDVYAYPCDAEGCDLVTVEWNSLARSDNVTFLACVLRDASGFILASVEYRGGGMLTWNSVGVVGPALPVGYVPDVHQRFSLLVDHAAGTTSLSVDGVALAGFQNVPFAEASAGTFARLGFEGGGTSGQQFAIDDLSAYTCDCPCLVDTTPPEIAVTLSPDMLWPPNHKMVEVCATVEVVDDCDVAPVVTLADVWSDEPDNGPGDGNTVDDIQGAELGTDDTCLLLRAERQGGGDGRVYSIVYCATDAAGNTACDTAYVYVPHDRSGSASPVAGFVPSGTALLPGGESIVLAVRSVPGLDATRIDPGRAVLGSHLGRIAAAGSSATDIDADGDADMLLSWPAEPVRALLAATVEDATMLSLTVTGDAVTQMPPVKSSVPTVALRYEIDGAGYLAPDLLALGKVVRIDEPGPGPRLPERPIDAGSITVQSGGRVELSLPAGGRASIQVFDIRGRRVRTLVDADLPAGLHGFVWDGTGDDGQRLASGIYFVKGEGPDFRSVHKISLMR